MVLNRGLEKQKKKIQNKEPKYSDDSAAVDETEKGQPVGRSNLHQRILLVPGQTWRPLIGPTRSTLSTGQDDWSSVDFAAHLSFPPSKNSTRPALSLAGGGRSCTFLDSMKRSVWLSQSNTRHCQTGANTQARAHGNLLQVMDSVVFPIHDTGC